MAAWAVLFVISFPVYAQIQIRTIYAQTQYLAYQPIQVEVAVTNNFGRPITLENNDKQPWLIFDVTDEQGHPIADRAKSPQFDRLSIEPGQTLGRSIQIDQFFYIQKPGRYKVQAVVYFEGQSYGSPRHEIFIESGRVIWQKKIALPPAPSPLETKTGVASSSPRPKDEIRTYELIRFTTDKGQQLFFKIEDEERELVYQCYSLGSTVLQHQPEAFLDSSGQFYVLHESSPRNYTFSLLGPDGLPKIRESYTAVRSRPTLTRDGKGNIVVLGGEKYVSPVEAEAKTK